MITATKKSNTLILHHSQQTALAPEGSGARFAHQKITNELMHFQRSYLQFTEQEALLLLQNKIIQRLHFLSGTSRDMIERRVVYIQYLSKNAKVPRATPIEVYNEVNKCIIEDRLLSPFQAFCFGLFFRAITTDDCSLRRDMIIPVMRDYILSMIDFFETVGNAFMVNQRQEAIKTFIRILGFLQ